MPIPLVIDTDTAADDCFALLLGLLDPRADLKAITIVAGNVGFAQQVDNAFLTLELAGRLGDVPVHAGAHVPLVSEWVGATEVHGLDGVGGQRRTNAEPASEEHAVDALVRLARRHAGELTIVAIGPLTNIALAVRRDPAFAANVRELVVMGGSLNGRGNVTPAAEYNIFVDPEAANIVVSAGFPSLRFVTWDPLTIASTVFGPERIAQIEALDTPLSRFFVRANRATFAFDHAAGLGGSTHPDSLSVAIALAPELTRRERPYRVAVELRGEHTRGATVFDWRADAVPNATAIEEVDSAAFFTLMRDLLAQRPHVRRGPEVQPGSGGFARA
ncbi:nucleoside hydrolase [Microbacterium sp. P03]|uniref:nucleoside hydrolase n=1 Tax=Microbacterium sp. P03 TaxID=3366946 RepID=UPI003746954F